MWYGLDCSNFTGFIYNFALGVRFSNKITAQAGLSSNNISLSPSQQTESQVLADPGAAGKLVCEDNTLENKHSCAEHGGYISVFDNQGIAHPGTISDHILDRLQPGDLLFIAPKPKQAFAVRKVTHVVMWTGKRVGRGVDDIAPEQIAPNPTCPTGWQPQQGDYVIIDSHYQGPDYRVFTPCFYLNNLWGVRRVIGVN